MDDQSAKKADLIRIMEYTQMNYNSMWKRLHRKAHFASFVVVYYSIFLIIYSLTQIIFVKYYHEALSSYFNIIMSIVVLVYSLVNGNARYDNRISTIKEAIDAVKREKRSLQLGNTTVEEAREKYDRIIESTEYREDIDFFVTVKLLCKKYEVCWWRIPHVSSIEGNTDQKRVVNYLHELNPYFLQCRIVFEFLGYVALIAVPIVIFVLCILAKMNSWIM